MDFLKKGSEDQIVRCLVRLECNRLPITILRFIQFSQCLISAAQKVLNSTRFRLFLGKVLEFLECQWELSQIEIRQPQLEFIKRELSELRSDSQQILQGDGIMPPAQQSLPKTQRVFRRIGIELSGASQLTDRGFILLSLNEKQAKISVRFSSIRPGCRSCAGEPLRPPVPSPSASSSLASDNSSCMVAI